MNVIKRAWLATKAKKGRTGLLVLVTSVILIFVLAGLTIKNAADSAVTSAKKQAGATVTLSVNRETMMKAFKPDSENSSDSSNDTTTTTSVELATAKSIAEKAMSHHTFSQRQQRLAQVTAFLLSPLLHLLRTQVMILRQPTNNPKTTAA